MSFIRGNPKSLQLTRAFVSFLRSCHVCAQPANSKCNLPRFFRTWFLRFFSHSNRNDTTDFICVSVSKLLTINIKGIRVCLSCIYSNRNVLFQWIFYICLVLLIFYEYVLRFNASLLVVIGMDGMSSVFRCFISLLRNIIFVKCWIRKERLVWLWCVHRRFAISWARIR